LGPSAFNTGGSDKTVGLLADETIVRPAILASRSKGAWKDRGGVFRVGTRTSSSFFPEFASGTNETAFIGESTVLTGAGSTATS